MSNLKFWNKVHIPMNPDRNLHGKSGFPSHPRGRMARLTHQHWELPMKVDYKFVLVVLNDLLLIYYMCFAWRFMAIITMAFHLSTISGHHFEPACEAVELRKAPQRFWKDPGAQMVQKSSSARETSIQRAGGAEEPLHWMWKTGNNHRKPCFYQELKGFLPMFASFNSVIYKTYVCLDYMGKTAWSFSGIIPKWEPQRLNQLNHENLPAMFVGLSYPTIIWLVLYLPPSEKNMSSSVGMMKFPIYYGKKSCSKPPIK